MIDAGELKIAMQALGFTPSNDEISKLLKEIDSSGDGTVDFQEFVDLMEGKMVTPISSPSHHICTWTCIEYVHEHNVYQCNSLKCSILFQAGKDPVEEMKKAFAMYDLDGKGKIVYADLMRVAKELGESLSEADIKSIIDESDRDGNGCLTEAEFINVMRNQRLI